MTTTLILLAQPANPRQASIYNRQELLKMQNGAFETLVCVLRKLDPRVHRLFLVNVLTIILDVPDLDQLPIVSLVSLLFALLDGSTEGMAILDMQSALIYGAQLLDGVDDGNRPAKEGSYNRWP